MKRVWQILAAAGFLAATMARGQSSDPIGLNALRALDPTLNGAGVIVAQAEAIASGTDGFEVNPAAVGTSGTNLVYISARGTSTSFPNDVGTESGHADAVGDLFYGRTNTSTPEGVAYGVKEIDNYNANDFYSSIVRPGTTAISARIVNQSFVFTTGTDTPAQAGVEQDYDNYAARFNTLFISGINNGNGEPVLAPGTAYNGIGVGAYGGSSSTGPNYDGRSKPDITAPGGATSFSTPLVSGAAAVLLQAGTRGDGGGTVSDATDARTLKALLLNGAVKPADWTHTATAPLDTRYGAGVLNVYNSYVNLHAGEAAVSGSAAGAIHSVSGSSFLSNEGWSLASVSNTGGGGSFTSETNYYEFNLTAATAPAFTLTSTLTWWRQLNQSSINNLDLYLFNADTGVQIALSDSPVDNVEELFVQNLAPGHYDLAVLKNGGSSINQGGSVVSRAETYALAFNFAPVPEPSEYALLAIGALGTWVARRWRSFRTTRGLRRQARL